MRVRILSVALTLGLAAASCGGTDDPTVAGGGDEEGGTITIGGQRANDHGTSDVAGESELEVELDDFYFEPTVLSGEAGQALTVDLFNEGDNPHTFTIEAQGIDEELQPGDEGVTVDVTFPDSGALLVVCRFHAGQGMVGALSVGGSLETSGGGGGGGPPDMEPGTDSDDKY